MGKAQTQKQIEIPAHSPKAQIIKHRAYTLKYSEKYEQAEWVAYRLTAEDLKQGVSRSDDFRTDPKVSTGSATLKDYKRSGYDRGHLAPAADMKRSKITMSQSFFMSNMSPQKPGFNRGIWKNLEEQVRIWVFHNEELYIVTAGILKGNMLTIGPNKVALPEYYYKAILDYKEPQIKAIAFILPNRKSNKTLQAYAVTINELEETTGIDFFPALPDDIEEKLESSIDLSAWSFDVKKSRGGERKKKEYTNTGTTRCLGTTKSGRRCKRKTSHSSGYCSQHR
ncbi:MAG: DNA/RNA non-specific endonuclease [bacterium]|nr:DNA/RNA non-specific endonuclease [bacterium]